MRLGCTDSFYGLDPGGTDLRRGDLDGRPPHGQGPGGFSDPSGETADMTDTVEDN